MNRQPYYTDRRTTLYTGDALDVLADLPAGSADCVVTSPPYWGLRDYGTGTWAGGEPTCDHERGLDQRCVRCGATYHDRQYGLEPTVEAYVDGIRVVAAQLRRVLVDTGTLWLNLGDCYAASPPGRCADPMRRSGLTSTRSARAQRESVRSAGIDRSGVLPRKNLVGVPWRVAFALQTDGWIVRNAIVWHKPNAMPESVRDRMSTRYEMLFLLVKQRHYWFDLDAVRVPLARTEAVGEGHAHGGCIAGRAGVSATVRRRGRTGHGKYHDAAPFAKRRPGSGVRPTGRHHDNTHPRGKNPGDVWSMPTRPLRAAHFAAFPVDIPLRAIAAGCPPRGVVLDPFSGAGTTGLAARQLGRSFVGIDLSQQFHDIAIDRFRRSVSDER